MRNISQSMIWGALGWLPMEGSHGSFVDSRHVGKDQGGHPLKGCPAAPWGVAHLCIHMLQDVTCV